MNDVVQTLREVSAGTDIKAMYDPQDMVENNLIKGTGHYVPDDMDAPQTMRFQFMSVLTACLNHVSSDFRNISNGVKRWTRRLKGKGNDKDHCDFMDFVDGVDGLNVRLDLLNIVQLPREWIRRVDRGLTPDTSWSI